MSNSTHQTVELAAGKHMSPDDGACVMELASMLAGEPFGDRPRSVCPVIGAVLRPYNDCVGPDRRQDLYAYAARVVGTRASRKITALRARTALRFFAEEAAPARRTRLSPFGFALAAWRLPAISRASARYARASSGESHAVLLSLVDRLIALGGADSTAVEAVVDARPKPAPARVG
jgi:hypothetical protein